MFSWVLFVGKYTKKGVTDTGLSVEFHQEDYVFSLDAIQPIRTDSLFQHLLFPRSACSVFP